MRSAAATGDATDGATDGTAADADTAGGGADPPWQATVLTLYPEMFPGPLGLSLAGRALQADRWRLRARPLRDDGIGRHRAVDDTPFGGGPGMVIRPDVVAAALAAALADGAPGPLLSLSPRGRPLDQALVRRLAAGPGVVLLCGRFEGVDARVIAARGLMEVSVGDMVLSGGEPAALLLLDACVRLLPGVMGTAASGTEESFEAGLLEYPHYTRPQQWAGRPVPPALLSGDHARIARWRRAAAEAVTRNRRPDLWQCWLAAGNTPSPAAVLEGWTGDDPAADDDPPPGDAVAAPAGGGMTEQPRKGRAGTPPPVRTKGQDR